MFPLIRSILFLFPPETSHQLTLKLLYCLHITKISKLIKKQNRPKQVMGLTFQNPIGLAAGFDKNGEYIDAIADLGFGFIEIGTVTFKPQPGNPRPRIFRLKKSQAIINRLGFNSKGIDYVITQLQKMRYQGVLGINIGKNRDTSNEQAVDDYVQLFRQVAPFASYVTINISSPNTPELRALQHGELLTNLLRALKQQQATYLSQHKKYIPLVIKISPDLDLDELKKITDVFLTEKVDGVIATNTTIARDGTEEIIEQGGLSGKPLTKRSTEIVRQLAALLQNQIPIIACGGVMSAEDVQDKLDAGAVLVQVYTGLIYSGLSVVQRRGDRLVAQ